MMGSRGFGSWGSGRKADSAGTDADAAATANRSLLLAFVQVGEQAKAAYDRGALNEAHRLYADALARVAPIAGDPHVQPVVAKFQTLLEETRPAASEMEIAVRGLIVPSGSVAVRWDDVIGLQDAKRALWEAVVLPGLNPDLFTGLRAPPKGILLFGPPGNGKTFLARAAAAECNATFFSVSASSLTSKWHGESEKLVRALFDVASQQAPSVVFLDEVDSVLSARSASESEAARRLKTEFLVKMEGITGGGGGCGGGGCGGGSAAASHSAHVMLLGATNRPFDLDEAVLRRFAVQVYVPLPDQQARAALLESSLRQHRHSLSANELQELAGQLQRFSSSDIRNLCREASMAALRELPPGEVARLRADDLRPIVARDFLQATAAVQPSVSQEAVEEVEEWARRRKR